MTGAGTRSTCDWVDSGRSISNGDLAGDCDFIPHGRNQPSARSGGDTARILEACLIALRIRHRTTYAYRRPVSLGPHRLMLRPRESRDLRLISSEINVTPDRRLDLGPRCLRQRRCDRHLFRHDGRPDDRRGRGTRASRLGVACVRHRGFGDRISVSIFGRRMDGSGRDDRPTICRPGRASAAMGARFCRAAIGQIRSLCSRTSAPAFPAG